jgi:hypothetical protein
LPHLGVCSRQPSAEIVAPPKQSSLRHWKFSKGHTGPRFAHGFQTSACIDYKTKLCRQQAEVIQNHENENVRNIGQGESRHRKYKGLQLAAVKHTTV